MGLYYCNPNHSTDAEFRLECIKREIANSTTILQKMRHEDVKDVFDCFDQNRPFKKDLNVQVILQDCGHKLSPPRLEFPGTFMHNLAVISISVSSHFVIFSSWIFSLVAELEQQDKDTEKERGS